MCSQVLPQQDFFIYVPEMQVAEERALQNCSYTEASSDEGVSLPSARDNWVKIPLKGEMVVYAQVWNQEE